MSSVFRRSGASPVGSPAVSVLFLFVCAGGLVVSGPASADSENYGFYPDWTEISTSYWPLSPGPLPNPVLTSWDVTDYYCSLVADPFMLHDDDGIWYMFFEAYVGGRGRVGLATSPDGFDWTYDRIVFSETNHLSFPFVYKWFDGYYMIPEQSATGTVKIYRATDFPYEWEYLTTIISGRQLVDPSIFYFRGVWYLFGSPPANDRAYLYFSHNMLNGWSEHPMSPVARGADRCRSAGRNIVMDSERIMRVAQKCDVVYGEAVRVFEIDSLSVAYYAEHEIPESPVLVPSGQGWNQDAMHQCDPWWNGERWIVATDGAQNGHWSIGIYQTTTPASAPGFAAPSGLSLDPSFPEPFRDRTTLAFEVAPPIQSPRSSAPGAIPVDLSVYDSGGRFICRLLHAPIPSGRVRSVWDGTDHAGRPVPAGRYFARLSRGGETASEGLILIR